MKKLLLLAGLALCITSPLRADTLNATCTPNPAFYPAGTAGSGTESCTWAGLPAGATITAVSASYGFDFTFNAGDTSAKTVAFSFDAPGTSLDWASTVTNLTRPISIALLIASAGDLPSLVGPFSVGDAYQQTAGTGVAAGIFNKTFTATYTPGDNPPPSVPEPASLVLLGTGLVAAVRRRKAQA